MTKARLIGFMTITDGKIVPVATVAKTRPAVVAAAEARLAEIAEPEPAAVVETVKTGNLGSGKALHVLVEVSDRKTGYAGYRAARAACGAEGVTFEGRIGREDATCKRCAKALAPATPKMGKRTLTATMPDGTTEDRTTARDYTHVVAVRTTRDGVTGGWGAWAWAGRLELAEGRVREFENRFADARRVAPGVTIETAIVRVNA